MKENYSSATHPLAVPYEGALLFLLRCYHFEYKINFILEISSREEILRDL